MLQYRKVVTFLTVISLAGGLMSAPSAKKAEGRSQAIDLLAEGQTLEQQGNKEAAWQKYYESAQAAPSPSAYYHLGRLARLAGQKDSARQWLNKALELAPKFELAKVELLNLNDGNSKSSNIVSTVSNEMAGNVAPGTTAALDTPMNVDALRREVMTMQSLAPPDPKRKAEEDALVAATASTPETADEIVLESEMTEEELPGSDVLSPTIDPKNFEEADATLPSLSETADAGKPSAADINDAAFGPESQKDPGSKGYGQSGKVVLGTFAFHREKGDDYRKANRFKEAAVEYKMAVELSPNDAETRALLAEMYGRLENPEKATAQFEKAKAQAPTNDSIYYKEGNAYFDDQKFDLAIGSYRKALDLNPKNKLALNNMGVAYMEKKDYATAADKLKQVLEIDPSYEMAVLNLGIIYDEHIIDKEQALTYYDRYLKLKGPRATEVARWADAIRAKSSN